MRKQEELDLCSHQKRHALASAACLALSVALLLIGVAARAYPGDQWILPIAFMQGSGWVTWGGAGYDGTDAIEAEYPDPVRRVYWTMTGMSISNTVFPVTTEQYTIEWYQPTIGGSNWQPIESQFEGSAGEVYPNDPNIPWVGEYGTSHEYIGAQGIDGTPGSWTTTGPGPHTPDSTSYNALGDDGIYMWLTRGSYLYAKWDFNFGPSNPIDHTWSALRLTQVTITRPVIKSVTKSGNTVTLTWSAGGGGNYQVQYKTNLTQAGWFNLGDTIPANNLTTSASDVDPPDASRFYRVEVLP